MIFKDRRKWRKNIFFIIFISHNDLNFPLTKEHLCGSQIRPLFYILQRLLGYSNFEDYGSRCF